MRSVSVLLVLLALGAHAAPLAVVRDPAAPKHCFTYTTKASDTVATLSRQLGVLFEALLRDNAPLRLSGNPRLAIKPKTPLRLCNVPKRFQDTQLQILNVIYDQFTAQGDPYRRVDTGLATYWVVPQPATYAQAAAFCAAQKGSLASITSAAENAEVAAAVLSAMALSQVDVWIGLQRAAGASDWSWHSKASSPYRSWAPSSPSIDQGQAACGTLRVAEGSGDAEWLDTPCNSITPGFVCRLRPRGPLTQALVPAPAPAVKHGTAPSGESVYEFSVNAPNDTARMWLVAAQKDMPAAELFCQEHSGHLASIHSGRGLDQLRQVAARFTGYVWMGLLKGPSGHVWTDQTPLNFVRWAGGEPQGRGICTVLASWSNLAGSAYYVDVPCGLQMMFVCRF